ncbi:3-hydroxyacyl-CoA dehydrogenase NAD-binding domain-containing protein [Virgibacillus xinjiangensis]|uniref:3-hydroxyacyl-CoA dehydrogenase NAD-binding domain-containing protein n=1 Tax=Virgibacillus xinjiangensis TaxID=393090 RepID=A0ABV7CYQ6_9BACI
MKRSINRAAVIGSGVMGSGIAAHLANIGIPVVMLDIVPRELTEHEKRKGLTTKDRAVRNRLAEQSKKALLKQKPSPVTTRKNLELIETGNMEDDLERLHQADWIIEVVTEDLAVKKKVMAIVEEHRKEGAIVSSNTSGISIEAMAEGRSKEFQRHFLGTHFFNPPRYLKLLEIIPTSHTDSDIVQFIAEFGENVLGKGVVEAKDTPNFIANRIGTYGLLVTVREMLDSNYSVGEVDSVTGPMIGRPKSATFRTLDVVGLDTFIHVAGNVHEQVVGKEKEIFDVPSFMKEMLEKGWLGAKNGQGFYHKKKENGGSSIYELDPKTLQYQERKKLKTAATEMAKQQKGTGNKLKALVGATGDRAGDLVWSVLKPVLIYSADLLGEIADDIVSIDQAMKWGFGWELGPFELWDAIGVSATVERMEQEGDTVPSWVHDMLSDGYESFYQKEDGSQYYLHRGGYQRQEDNPRHIDLKNLKSTQGALRKNSGASLIDLGDGIACLEFHSQNNAIGLDIIQMVNSALEEVDQNYDGLVIGNQGKNFCVGANLAMMLLEAQDDNFYELELVIRKFQEMTMNIKYSTKPIVAAPFNMALGGGAEVALPAAAIQASLETYMGLVEVGVGLIPGGGGTKELYLKELRNLPNGVDIDLMKIANDVFEKVATAKVSESAAEARENGFLNTNDRISANPDHLLFDAKKRALALAEAGYRAPAPEKVPVVGNAGYALMLLGAKTLQNSGYATAHDVKIAEKLAHVLSGGRIREGSLIDEQVMLDLEREAFLSLIGEPLTQTRMQHMLVKGKPLRN